MLLAAAGTALADDFPWAEFKPGTISGYVTVLSDMSREIPATAKASSTFDATPASVKLRVVYTGESRAIGPEKLRFLADFGKSLQIEEAHVRLYQREYRFVEAGRSYWLPVQTPVTKYFDKELKPGEVVELYAVCAGGFGTPKSMEPVVLVEEFQALPKS